MQRDAVAQLVLALCATRSVQLGRRCARGRDGGERPAAGVGRLGRDRKDREHAVAHELQHLAARGLERRHQGVEVAVQERDHPVSGQAVAQSGEAAQVGEQDHRVDALDVAAADPPLEDAPPRAVADVGAQQRARDPAERMDLGDPGERPRDRLERGAIGVREAAGPRRGPADRVDLAVRERERLDQVVGDALGAQLLDDAEVVRTVGIGEPAADRAAAAEDQRDRAREIALLLEQAVRPLADLDLPVRPPQETPAHDVGMERAHEDRDPMQRQAAGQQARAQLGQHVLGPLHGRRAIDQPVERRPDAAGHGWERSFAHGYRPEPSRRGARAALGVACTTIPGGSHRPGLRG